MGTVSGSIGSPDIQDGSEIMVPITYGWNSGGAPFGESEHEGSLETLKLVCTEQLPPDRLAVYTLAF